jgi:ubiquinone/menaquinone biosynthesis C-methylase UbiE/uncharacterized protein YbaR (Trm112 family)
VIDRPAGFICPACKGALDATEASYGCPACAREYPVVCGIPDFRLEPDPYISLEADRAKGAVLREIAATASFEQLLRRYYDMTPEDPPDLADGWIRHSLAEVEIAGQLFRDGDLSTHGVSPARESLLDVGCSTGALLAAVNHAFEPRVGVDVAFRWLVVGQARLKALGIQATLVCANAEHLPFAAESFSLVTCVDTLEHLRDPGAALVEARRVLSGGGRLVCEGNNRWAPASEPNVRIWGVGWLPRHRQAAYVAARRPDLHPYRIRLRSARELSALASRAGYEDVQVSPAPLVAPHLRGWMWRRLLRLYNAARLVPLIRQILTLMGPRLRVTATVSHPPSPSATARAGT